MPIPISNIVLTSNQLEELENKHPGVSATIIGLQQDTRGVTTTVLDTPSLETTKKIDYKQLASEHAELLSQGKTSVEIAEWIGDKLNIPSWKTGEFYGERKVLSSLKTQEETKRFREFVEALGVSYNNANDLSRNHPQYLLLDGYVQNALFGQTNMIQVDAVINTFDTDWKKMGDDFTAKAKYLLEKIGLDIKGDWSKITGTRNQYGYFSFSEALFTSGSFKHRNLVNRLMLRQHDSDISLVNLTRYSHLCFLA